MCSPKPVTAVTSCKGCLKELCRKHFNEHRDALSQDLNSVFNQHDALLQELQREIDRAKKPTDNNSAYAILKQIDEWETTTVTRVSQIANEARASMERLFNRKPEYDRIKQKIGQILDELKEQQESESFVETDVTYWTRQLEQLKTDLNRPSTIEISPPVLQIQNIDWNATIKILSSAGNALYTKRQMYRRKPRGWFTIKYRMYTSRLRPGWRCVRCRQ